MQWRPTHQDNDKHTEHQMPPPPAYAAAPLGACQSVCHATAVAPAQPVTAAMAACCMTCSHAASACLQTSRAGIIALRGRCCHAQDDKEQG